MTIRAWFAGIGVRDAVERRQAYILQVVVVVIVAAFLIVTVGNDRHRA